MCRIVASHRLKATPKALRKRGELHTRDVFHTIAYLRPGTDK